MRGRALFTFRLSDYPANGYASRLRATLVEPTPALSEARQRTVGPHKMQTDPDGEDRASVGPPLGKNLRTRTRGLRGPPTFSLLGKLDELPDTGFGSDCTGGLDQHVEEKFAEMQTLSQPETPDAMQICKNSIEESSFGKLGQSLAGVHSPRSFAWLGLCLASGAGLSDAADYFKKVIALDSWDLR